MCVIKPLQAIGNLVLKAMEALSTYWFLLLDRIGDALNVIGKKSSDITHSVAKTFALRPPQRAPVRPPRLIFDGFWDRF